MLTGPGDWEAEKRDADADTAMECWTLVNADDDGSVYISVACVSVRVKCAASNNGTEARHDRREEAIFQQPLFGVFVCVCAVVLRIAV